jgi:hypothetical protein
MWRALPTSCSAGQLGSQLHAAAQGMVDVVATGHKDPSFIPTLSPWIEEVVVLEPCCGAE